jgi:hypothetical protein
MPNIAAVSGPGSFALLDNLALGLPANVPHKGDPGLTITESQTHMAIWYDPPPPHTHTHTQSDAHRQSLAVILPLSDNPRGLTRNAIHYFT